MNYLGPLSHDVKSIEVLMKRMTKSSIYVNYVGNNPYRIFVLLVLDSLKDIIQSPDHYPWLRGVADHGVGFSSPSCTIGENSSIVARK